MNHNEHPNDGALIRELRDRLSELAAPERPALAAVTTRGRAHQRRRRAALAGLGVTSAAAGTALALGLAGVLGAAPAPRGTATNPAAATARGAGAIRTAAFTLTRNANGTDTLTLTHSQMFDPAALQRALAQHGIRALVRTGIYCVSTPAAPDLIGTGVMSIRPPIKPRHGLSPVPSGQKLPNLSRIIAHTKTVINPAAMPAGTELFFGYSSTGHALFTDLIYTHSHTCSTGQPPGVTAPRSLVPER